MSNSATFDYSSLSRAVSPRTLFDFAQNEMASSGELANRRAKRALGGLRGMLTLSIIQSAIYLLVLAFFWFAFAALQLGTPAIPLVLTVFVIAAIAYTWYAFRLVYRGWERRYRLRRFADSNGIRLLADVTPAEQLVSRGEHPLPGVNERLRLAEYPVIEFGGRRPASSQRISGEVDPKGHGSFLLVDGLNENDRQWLADAARQILPAPAVVLNTVGTIHLVSWPRPFEANEASIKPLAELAAAALARR